MSKSPITTHILDTSRGRPAGGVSVRLERLADDAPPRALATGRTDDDGRVSDLLAPDHRLDAGLYRLTFDVEGYFAAQGVAAFYPAVAISFHVRSPDEHYHVPLLLSPFGYSTYRGS